MGVEYASQASVTGQMGTAIAPVFGPLGFGEWQPAISLIFGVLAKEVVVSTFGTIYGVGEGGGIITALHDTFTPLSAFSFMAFVLLYMPCFATFGTIKRETNSWKWPIFTAGYMLVVAWFVSFIIYQGGSLLGFS
jgi:ferrous iron transport protein B